MPPVPLSRRYIHLSVAPGSSSCHTVGVYSAMPRTQPGDSGRAVTDSVVQWRPGLILPPLTRTYCRYTGVARLRMESTHRRGDRRNVQVRNDPGRTPPDSPRRPDGGVWSRGLKG